MFICEPLEHVYNVAWNVESHRMYTFYGQPCGMYTFYGQPCRMNPECIHSMGIL